MRAAISKSLRDTNRLKRSGIGLALKRSFSKAHNYSRRKPVIIFRTSFGFPNWPDLRDHWNRFWETRVGAP